MVYKSKKLNKGRYFKRQSRKRMCGGDYNIGINKQADKIASNNIMKEIEDKNKLDLSKIEEIPIAGPIIEKTGDLVEGVAVKGLDIMGNAIGVDINNPESIGEKLDDIKNAVSSPENVEKTKEILSNAGEYVGLLVDASAPIIEKTSEKILPVVKKETAKALNASLSTGINLAENVAGPFVGIPRTLWSAAEAFNASVNAGSELIKGTAEAIQGTQQNFNRIVNEMPNVSTKISYPELNPKIGQNFSDVRQEASDSLKNAQKVKMMIGGRILKSQSEFLDSHLNSSYNDGKRKTKRRNFVKRRLSSRSYK